MNFNSKRPDVSARNRKASRNTLRRANSKIDLLEQSVGQLRRTNWKLTKRLQRSTETHRESDSEYMDNPDDSQTDSTPAEPEAPLATSTPRSKSDAQLRADGVSPGDVPAIRKQLIMHNSMMSDLTAKGVEQINKSKSNLLRASAAAVLKKYRLSSLFSRQTNIDRRNVRIQIQPKTRLLEERRQTQDHVVTFIGRDDNSTCLPGKADCMSTLSAQGVKEKVQKRVLTDYLHNLHSKYLSEYPHTTLSLTSFKRLRPTYIALASYGSRNTCLCQIHQNLTLKLEALLSLKVVNTKNADSVIKQHTDSEILEKIANVDGDVVTYKQWKRCEIPDKPGKQKMKIVTKEKPKAEFVALMADALKKFREHVDRVQTQFLEIRNLKMILPENHVICQMDYAENYLCSHHDEIQSAYFDKTPVTLHPMVVYYCVQEELLHQSYVMVSDVTSHAAGTVFSFLHGLIPQIKELLPAVDTIHYVTDSPTSQYRNKHIFYLISSHATEFGINCSWQYMEAGHGKGPCDGVGGTAKRMADMAVTHGKYTIQDAEDFYNWGVHQTGSVKYLYMSKSECAGHQKVIDDMPVSALKGTMKVHSVMPRSVGVVAVRNTSCFCSSCFHDGKQHPSCDGWSVESVASDGQVVLPTSDVAVSFASDAFVVAMYNSAAYLGQVIEYDSEDDEYLINFMQRTASKMQTSFKWPERTDTVWIPSLDVKCQVEKPIMMGKIRKFYVLKMQTEYF